MIGGTPELGRRRGPLDDGLVHVVDREERKKERRKKKEIRRKKGNQEEGKSENGVVGDGHLAN